MASEYIQPADYSAFGLPSGTTAVQVQAASAVVDGFIQRPAGCVYSVNQSGVPATMAATGAAISEFHKFPNRRRLQLSYSPLARVIAVEQRNNGAWSAVTNLPQWEESGALWLDNASLVRFVGDGDLRISYVAGWTYASLPSAIKQAVANIIAFANSANMPGNIKKQRAGDTEIERFDDTAMDGDTRAMLAPYRRVFA